jgi:class 3 adenylate cyclase
MKNFRLLPVVLVAVAVLPLGLFLWVSASLLKKSLKSTVVNDPQAGLSQSISGFGGAYNSYADRLLMAAVRFSEKDSLRKELSEPVLSDKTLKPLCEEVVRSSKASLFILTDRKGNVLYDNLGIPKPTPLPTPATTPSTPATQPAKPKEKKPKDEKSKTTKKEMKHKEPVRASIKDWAGMDRALAGTGAGGVLPYQGNLYRVMFHPVAKGEKVEGVILIGDLIDKGLLESLKLNAGNDLAIYSQAQTWSTKPSPPAIDYSKDDFQFNSLSIQWDHQDYLAAGLPLMGADQKALGTIVIFQPVKQSLTLEGNPRKSIVRLGLTLLFLATLVAAGFSAAFLYFFGQLTKSVDQIATGNLNVEIASNPLTEWGLLGGSLKNMVESLKERDRISLILGKVVDPQAARKILADKDYFALKGERRECTLLQADLKGFNTLSENMAPEALVEALNQYFGIINEVVFKHEGMLDKFIGDTAIAVWGAPFSHEDKEKRAVQTALEIQTAFKDFNISRIKKGYPPFTIGVGIHTGMVVAGNLGSEKRYDYSIIGEALHVVSKLCSLAAPGQTIVSDETYQKIKPLVKANALNPIAVKGSMESLNTFEVTQFL